MSSYTGTASRRDASGSDINGSDINGSDINASSHVGVTAINQTEIIHVWQTLKRIFLFFSQAHLRQMAQLLGGNPACWLTDTQSEDTTPVQRGDPSPYRCGGVEASIHSQSRH